MEMVIVIFIRTQVTEEEAYVVVDGKKVHQLNGVPRTIHENRYKYKGDEDLRRTILEIDLENARRKLKYDPNLTKNERENLEVGLGLRTPKKGKTLECVIKNAQLLRRIHTWTSSWRHKNGY